MILSSLFSLFAPTAAHAGQLNDRKMVLGSSQVSTSTTNNYTFSPQTSTTILSIEFLYCDSPTATCTPGTAGSNGIPAGINTNTAALNSTSGLGSGGTWTVAGSPSQGRVRISNASNTGSPSAGATVFFNTITNPSTTGTYYVRVKTFSDASWSTPAAGIDSGVIAVSTANRITINAYVPESLTFCVYQAGTCGSPTGNNTVDLGTLSASSVTFGTSKVDCGSNANGGYVITYSGDTLKQGTKDITAIGASATASTPTTEQFGFNAVDNTSPNVGSNPSGTAPIGRAFPANYDNDDAFAFDTASLTTPVTFADSGSTPGPTNLTTFTLSWIANISTLTDAGNYTTTVTFVATATF